MNVSDKMVFERPDQEADFGLIDKEFVLSNSDFEEISRKIYKMTGIVIPNHKKQMIYSRLSRRLRDKNIETFSKYLAYLETDGGNGEVENFTNAVTTNITGFFREAHHFSHLENQVSKLRRSNGELVNIWSAGCSTGQEPYSIAMSIHDTVASQQSDYRVLATDIDTSVLRTARAGSYEVRHFDEIPVELRRYAIKGDSKICLSDKLKERIYFKRLNLLEELPFRTKFNFIFCRNVLIYFDVKHKISVINKLASRLSVGGFLYLGHSETLFEDVPSLRSCGKTIYEKIV